MADLTDVGDVPTADQLARASRSVDEDGNIVIDMSEEPTGIELSRVTHGDNLALFLDDEQLADLAQQTKAGYDADKAAKAKWWAKAERAIRATGLVDVPPNQAFSTATCAVHPGLMIGILHFYSRCITEFWPVAGPVTSRVYGAAPPPIADRAARVQAYMNYLLEEQIKDAFSEDSYAFLDLPLIGSSFKKIFTDSRGRIRDMYVPAERLTMAAGSTCLYYAPRITEEVAMPRVELRRAMATGYYRAVELDSPSGLDDGQLPTTFGETDDTPPASLTTDPAEFFDVLEQHVDLDLEKFDYPVPYIVTALAETGDILAVRRNWAEGDPDFNKLQYYVEYKMPSRELYGYGFFHYAAGLTETQTQMLRDAVDAVRFATSPGGFVTAEGKDIDETVRIEPSVFRRLRTAADDLKKAFFIPPFKELNPAVFQGITFLDGYWERLLSTTDVPVGDIKTDMPVGTATIMVEQSNRVPNALLLGFHKAKSYEYELLRREVFNNLTEGQSYPFMVLGQQQNVMKEDFDGSVGVYPSSNPGASSKMQRMSQAQAVYQMSRDPNSIFDPQKAEQNFARALEVPNLESLLKSPQTPPPPPPPEAIKAQADMQLAQAEDQRKAGAAHLDALDKVGKMDERRQRVEEKAAMSELKAAQMVKELQTPIEPPGGKSAD